MEESLETRIDELGKILTSTRREIEHEPWGSHTINKHDYPKHERISALKELRRLKRTHRDPETRESIDRYLKNNLLRTPAEKLGIGLLALPVLTTSVAIIIYIGSGKAYEHLSKLIEYFSR